MPELNSSPFFDRLVVDNPRLAIKYMGHLAHMIIGDAPGNVRRQLIHARVDQDESSIQIAQQRNRDLRDKFMTLCNAYHMEHVIIGNAASHGDARAIFDVVVEERGTGTL